MLVTSANDSLVGNDQPNYWRFTGRRNADGALREEGGPELEAACRAIEPVTCGVRRDVVRWTRGVKRGASAVVRCPTGSAVATPAFGKLQADAVVHAVAPDVEWTHGKYRGPSSKGDDQMRPPEELLRSAYTAALARAADCGAVSVACPALGCGVKGWKPSVSAAFGLEAAARLAATRGPVRELTFVMHDDACWLGWLRAAIALLPAMEGATLGEGEASRFEAARGLDQLEWTIDVAALSALGTRARRASRNTGSTGRALDSRLERADGWLAEDLLELNRVAELTQHRVNWSTEAAGLDQGGNWRWQPGQVRAVAS